MKKITLCADDYGMHPAVSNGIIDLILQQRLHATSCLVTSEHWSTASAQLAQARPCADIGLHLNFTEGKGLSQGFRSGLPGLGKTLLLSQLRLLDQHKLRQEIQAQLQNFMDTTGFAPDFVDGHQHVHHLPQVRDALLQTLEAVNLPKHFWIRSVDPLLATTGGIKNQVILYSGAKVFRQLLKRKAINSNKTFAGVYSLAENEPFADYMNNWLGLLPDRSLIMCHPARISGKANIDHVPARDTEFQYLGSPDFSRDCEKYGISLTRLRS